MSNYYNVSVVIIIGIIFEKGSENQDVTFRIVPETIHKVYKSK